MLVNVMGFWGEGHFHLTLEISLDKKVYRPITVALHCKSDSCTFTSNQSLGIKKKLEHFHLEICALDLIVIL